MFVSIRWADKKVCDLQLNTPLTISSSVRCKDAISVLLREGFDMVPIVDDEGGVIGVVTEGNLSKMLMSKRAQPNQPLSDAGVIYKTFKKLLYKNPTAYKTLNQHSRLQTDLQDVQPKC